MKNVVTIGLMLSAWVIGTPAYAASLNPSLFFENISGCQASEFNNSRLIGGLSRHTTPTELRNLAGEVVRPTRFNKMYFAGTNRPNFARNLIELSKWLKSNGFAEIPVEEVRSAAIARYSIAKKNAEIGECVDIETPGGAKYLFGSKTNSVFIEHLTWQSIGRLFLVRDHHYLPLTQNEQLLLHKQEMNIAEILELRAIRRAVQLFQANSLMARKSAGGFISNISGEISGSNQQNCAQQSSTIRSFLEVLTKTGLVKIFTHSYQALILPKISNLSNDPFNSGHVATRLVVPSSGLNIVIDTWFEDGQTPPHILRFSQWENLSLWMENKFNDLVQTAL